MIGLLQNRAYKQAITNRLNGSAPGAIVPAGGRSQKIINRAMFAVMGRIAKLDGRVTTPEVNYASIIMRLLGLDPLGRLEAIDYFELGKQPETDVLPFVRELVSSIGRRSALARLFIKIQCRLAFIKGDIRLKEKILLRDVAESLGFCKAEFLEICREMQIHASLKQENGKFLRNAYHILQLEPDVEDGEIRRAYLRMMSRYHPDKLVRENLSEETLRIAQEKSTAIRSAYETVCGFRKIRA
ncbi:MAG: co-chaperone DjlA [Gammaproteobacteria bacterium]|nr:co-chaperone DjlA [Gammaproteobacteria bacterium]